MTGSITVHLVATLVPLTVGIVYGWMITRCINSRWYVNLKKPAFHPPAILIAVTFASVNALIGYASGLICAIERSPYHLKHDANGQIAQTIGSSRGLSHLHKLAIIAYLIQFFLNGIWPIILFATRNIPLTLFPLIIVDAATIFTCRLFYESSTLAGALSLPHLCWLILWTLIVFSLWILNGTSNGSYEKLVSKGTMTPHFITQLSVTQLSYDRKKSRPHNFITVDSVSTKIVLSNQQTSPVDGKSKKNKSKTNGKEIVTYGTLVI